MLFAPRKPKTAVFTMFFASGSKNPRYLQCFLDNTEQKHWYLRNVRHDFSMQKSQNPCKLQCFGSDFRVCDGVRGVSKMNSNRSYLSWPKNWSFTIIISTHSSNFWCRSTISTINLFNRVPTILYPSLPLYAHQISFATNQNIIQLIICHFWFPNIHNHQVFQIKSFNSLGYIMNHMIKMIFDILKFILVYPGKNTETFVFTTSNAAAPWATSRPPPLAPRIARKVSGAVLGNTQGKGIIVVTW